MSEGEHKDESECKSETVDEPETETETKERKYLLQCQLSIMKQL